MANLHPRVLVQTPRDVGLCGRRTCLVERTCDDAKTMRRGRADGEHGRTKSRALPHQGVRYPRVINLAKTRERLVGLGVHLGGKMMLHKCTFFFFCLIP